MSIKERAELFCEHRKIRLAAFCRAADISNGYFTSKREEIGYAIGKKITRTFPDLNLEWLQTGVGEMLKVPATVTMYNPTAEERSEVGDGIDLSVMPAGVVEEIRKELKEEVTIPVVPRELAGERDVDIRAYVEQNGDELEHIDLTKLTKTKRPDVAEEVTGTSMYPTFVPGDWVFIKYLYDKAQLVDGKTYYLETRNLPTMVRKVKIEKDGNLRLIAKNPEFGDIIISPSDIKNFGKVVGMFRQTFGDLYDEIEALRRKKDLQLDSMMKQSSELIEQNGQALQIIKDLINK